MNLRIKTNDLLRDAFLILILTNNIINTYIPFFSYFDELIELVCIIFVIKNYRNIAWKEKKIIGMLIAIVLIGFFGTIRNSYQSNAVAIIKDIFLVLKFPIIMVALIIRTGNRGGNINSKHIIYIINVYTFVLFVFGIISLFKDIGMSQNYDIRYGIAPFQFLYNHPTFLAYSLVFMSIVLIGNISDYKKHISTQLAILFLLILTMRDKAFAYVTLYILLVFIIPNGKKIRPIYFVIAGIAAFLISFHKIKEYASFSWSPRYQMYYTMIQLIKDNFPLGSGLASFGSNLSGEYYSKLYYIYGVAQKMGPDNYTAFNDSQWPYYFGQFGFWGGILFFVVLWFLFKECRNLINNKKIIKPLYLMFGYILISTIVETFFCNESGATIGFSVLMFGGNLYKYIREKKE